VLLKRARRFAESQTVGRKSVMSDKPANSDRRLRRRYMAGLPARVHISGISEPMMAELADLSAVGCFLRGEDVSFLASPGDTLAFGCVLDDRVVALARGRVVRRSPGDGLGICIEQANDVMDSLLGVLAASECQAA
jgi:hypothetical protein